MLTDFTNILIWWAVFLGIGIISLPLTSLLFKSFFDQGYALTKILGILLTSYFVWFIASLNLFPFSFFTIIAVIIFFAVINFFILQRQKLLPVIKNNWKIYIFEEIIFLLALIFWSYVRAHEPSIHGLEKYMDFGFINSILRSNYFPPSDPWLTPFSINYYYFGHFVAAFLTKLSLINPVITYNLMVATIFAITFSVSFSIASNLYYFFSKSNMYYVFLAGLLGAFIVTLGGNLHTIYIFFQSYVPPENPLPFWQLPFQLNLSGYWYPNATRFIPLTIHEFPIYSFVVSDLHGHVLNIPFVLLIIASFITIFHSLKLNIAHYALLSLLIAVFLMTNVLDGPIYLLFIFLILLVKNGIKNWQKTFVSLIIILVGAILLSLPYWFSFKPFGSALGVICAPQFLVNLKRLGPLLFEADHCARSPFWMLMILWGFFYFVVFVFLFAVLKIKNLFKNGKFIIENIIDKFILVLIIGATLLIIIPEFLYVKDIYPAHYRANTVFKFGYQAFIMLGLVSGFIITRFVASFQKTKTYLILAIPLLFLFLLVAIYPYFAINSYYNGLKNYQGLDGLKYLSDLYPNDYKAILWINKNITNLTSGKLPVIIEAQGDSYTDYARVSANTGLPTVLGWPVHEWLWRGSYDEAGKRITDIKEFYENSDLSLVKLLIKYYNIEYVFIGDLERQKYPKLDEEKFKQIGEMVFEEGNTKIYRIKSL